MYLNNYQYFKKNETFSLLFLILISIFIRIPIIILYGDTSLENEWKVIVNNLVTHETLSFRNLNGYLLPNLFMPPLYAIYLYCFSFFNFDEINYIRLILTSQILLSSISVLAFYEINKNFFSKKISFYSSLFFSLFPLHVYACSQISSISLQTFLTILFFYFFFQILKNKSLISNLCFAFISGLLMLLRGEFVIIFIFSITYLYFFLKVSAKNIMLILLISIITISPYLIRNIITFNTLTITKSFGYNLWKGNNLNSSVEGYETISVKLQNKIDEIPINHLYEINLDKIFLNQALENIKSDPKKYFSLFFQKILSFIFIDINSTQRNYYNPLHYLPILIVGITSLIGIYLSKKNSYKLNYLIFIFIINVAIFSCFFILPRYKLIILPLQIIFSNILVEYIKNKFFNSNERTK